MRTLALFFSVSTLVLAGCSIDSRRAEDSQKVGHLQAMAEMVALEVKPLGLAEPLGPEQAEALWPAAQQAAKKQGVQVYRDTTILLTDLYPDPALVGKEVFVFYKGLALNAYQDLKRDQQALKESGTYTGEARQAIARRFGRLLGYSPQAINQLLAKNTEFRSATDFGLRGSQVVFYYQNLDRATTFYEETLGLRRIGTFPNARLFWVAEQSYLLLVDAAVGMHSAQEPKSVALALITEQLAGWWDYLNAQGVPIRYGYTPREGGPHDGFVAFDPEGYLLEFETFKQHPENEKFIPQLRQNTELFPQAESTVPDSLAIHSTITWLYYQDVLGMQRFYEEVMGLSLVADQGWTKVYQVSPTGFLGLVDERRGMNDYAPDKAVNVSFLLDDLTGWETYANQFSPIPMDSTAPTEALAGRYRRWVGKDPEGYTLEFARYQADSLHTMEH